ncbi:hypothetical protein MP228_008887 [Amoeboaphelidium protococcarum]|nr:hypothetical protein MP228_008887 [Amoeboaphelidium protococcarum]
MSVPSTKDLINKTQKYRRNGVVLTSGTLLKRDHFPRKLFSNKGASNVSPLTGTGDAQNGNSAVEQSINAFSDNVYHLEGAPNFRFVEIDHGGLVQQDGAGYNIFGCSQPTITGLETVIHLLMYKDNIQKLNAQRKESTVSVDAQPQLSVTMRKHSEPLAVNAAQVHANFHHQLLHQTDLPSSSSQDLSQDKSTSIDSKHMIKKIVWINTREEPIMYISGKPYVLRDVGNPFQNISTYNGISAARLEQMEQRLKNDILYECKRCGGLLLVYDELDDGVLIPSWIAANEQNVLTTAEVFGKFKNILEYHRVPVSPEQRPEDVYVDEYIKIISNCTLNDAVVFNCGLGVGRTTFGMVCGVLLRESLYQVENLRSQSSAIVRTLSRMSLDKSVNFSGSHEESLVMLRLIACLEKGLDIKNPSEFLMHNFHHLDQLKDAVRGNYAIILKLVSLIDDGFVDKRTLDHVIDKCDRLVNLRDEILSFRLAYMKNGDEKYLKRAVGFLERYYFLLILTAYVNDKDRTQSVTFSKWLSARPEIKNTLDRIRNKIDVMLFRPVMDMFHYGDARQNGSGVIRGIMRGQFGKNEHDMKTIRNRNGAVLSSQTILKADFWRQEQSQGRGLEIQNLGGASNFRRINGLPVFAVAQPTLTGIQNVVSTISNDVGPVDIIWINMREEPLIYINGTPYVLRDEFLTLRNTKAYSGITQSRLEMLEERLKEDVVKEVEKSGGKILLHQEIDGAVIPTWVIVDLENIKTLRQIAESIKDELRLQKGIGSNASPRSFDYHRVPVTAESAMEEGDFDQILRAICHSFKGNSVSVTNCQIGVGRSTIGSIITILILAWLKKVDLSQLSREHNSKKSIQNYQVIHSLLRVVKNGLEVKDKVDVTIDACAAVVNVRDQSEEYRSMSENALQPEDVELYLKKSLNSLHRYFLLIAFQAYLNDNQNYDLEQMPTFQDWMANHLEFQTLINEMYHLKMNSLIPVGNQNLGDGVALSSEVSQVVRSRRGSVLAQHMILKFDHFPGCQKLTLTDRVEGAPNFRQVDISSIDELSTSDTDQMGRIYGVAMPTKDAIKSVLERTGSGVNGQRTLQWVSLREEPVLYVNGKPFVLRTSIQPVKNLETTGIVRERVEGMELRMKNDALREIQEYDGRLMLHEEEVSKAGAHPAGQIVCVWESVKPEDIQTPAEVYEELARQGYKVQYHRLPITDEQAPLPKVFDELLVICQSIRLNTDAIFNCQMGRGRTTTAMVTACINQMVQKLSDDDQILSPRFISSDDGEDVSPGGSEDGERQMYLRGEFKIVLQLLRVLQFGRLAKSITDRAIDACAHVQNIRMAIYDYKVRVEAMEPNSKAYHGLYTAAQNYLIRYFYLIVFASYLLEKGKQKLSQFPSFHVWQQDRREILNILSLSNQDLK